MTPLTTYTHTTREPGTDTVSSANGDRLPPGGFTLRHGFPEWFHAASSSSQDAASPDDEASRSAQDDSAGPQAHGAQHPAHSSPPHIVEVLQYLRVAFDTEALLDSLPLDAAANSGAWHAWKSHRAKSMPRSASPVTRPSRGISEASREQTLSSRNQQPGGARRPGEWNWQGVWEDRVRKSIIASNSEPVLFGAEGNDVVCRSVPLDRWSVMLMRV